MNSKTEKKLNDFEDALILHEHNINSVHNSNLSNEAPYTQTSKNQKVESNDTMKKNSDVVCKYCGVKGHWLNKCFKWIKDGKFPAGYRVSDSESPPSNPPSRLHQLQNRGQKLLSLSIVSNLLLLHHLLMIRGGLIMELLVIFVILLRIVSVSQPTNLFLQATQSRVFLIA